MMIENEHGKYLCWIGNYTDIRDRFKLIPNVLRKIETAWTVSNFGNMTFETTFGKNDNMYIKCTAGDSIIILGFKESLAN